MKTTIQTITKALLLLTLVVTLTGCLSKEDNDALTPANGTNTGGQGTENQQEDPVPVDETPAGPTEVSVEFETIDPDTLDANTLWAIEKLKDKRGYYLFEGENGKQHLFVSMGEQPTGGYAIDINTITAYDNYVGVLVSETEPDPDMMVTQALTYPYVLVALDKQEHDFLVTDSENQTLSLLSDASLTLHTLEAVYIGQQDGNSIEVEVDKDYLVFWNYGITEMVDGLATRTPVTLIYSEDAEGRMWLESITAN